MTIRSEYIFGMFDIHCDNISYSSIEKMYYVNGEDTNGVGFQGFDGMTEDVERKLMQKCDEIHRATKELKEIIEGALD